MCDTIIPFVQSFYVVRQTRPNFQSLYIPGRETSIVRQTFRHVRRVWTDEIGSTGGFVSIEYELDRGWRFRDIIGRVERYFLWYLFRDIDCIKNSLLRHSVGLLFFFIFLEYDGCENEDLPLLLCAITGKGPLKAHYQEMVKRCNWKKVVIVTPWLEAEDYPRLLGKMA